MAFTTINTNTPQGTDRGKVLDENIRELKLAVTANFAQISGYPSNNALVTQAWETAGRPTEGLKEGITGWNETLCAWDRYTGTGWEQLGGAIQSWTVSGRPSTPGLGQFGYNTELGVIERYSGIEVGWTRVAGGRRGDIKMWSGSVTDIEAGWVLCDNGVYTHPEGGNVGQPDLRDRFIVGAGNTYVVAATGGEATHTLTIAEMPKHKHYALQPRYNVHYPSGGSYYGDDGATETGETGGDGAHNNLPPYYALCFLYKM